MINRTVRNLKMNLSNIPGWMTSKKIIVFESDDWGSIRTSSIEAVQRLILSGIDFLTLDATRYSYNDTLASYEDLDALFEVLTSVKDQNNHSAIFTAVCLVANPDFDAIRNNGFTQYVYEPFTETLKRYPGCERSFELWDHGIKEGIFVPQFHGREHLNVTAWMNALKNNHKETHEVFSERMWGYVNRFYDDWKVNYQEAFNINNPNEISFLEDVITDGLNLFETLFGYRAKFFVAPNGPFPKRLEKILSTNGISYISQAKIQNEPIGYGQTRRAYHYIGKKNEWDQIYLTRNCFFEPGSHLKEDWVSSCMHEIETAFRWHKPAVIGSHRVNYIGSLNVKNRENSLKQLNDLLIKIKNRWKEVEFMSSDQLGSLILESKKDD